MIGAAALLPLVGNLFSSQADETASDNLLAQQQVLAMGGTKSSDNTVFIVIGVFAVLGIVMYFALKNK